MKSRTFYYGLPDLNYSLEFDDELEILRSMAKLALEWGDKALLRIFTKYVTDACAKVGSIPSVISSEEISSLAFRISDFLGEEWCRFASNDSISSWKPDIDQIVKLMDSLVPKDEAAEAYEIVYREKDEVVRENRYVLGNKLSKLCEDGNKKSPIEEFGLLRRIVREYVCLYSESLEVFDENKKEDRRKIISAMTECAEVILQCLSVASICGRTLSTLSRATYVANISNFRDRCRMLPDRRFSNQDIEAFYYSGIEKCGGEIIEKSIGTTIHLPEKS